MIGGNSKGLVIGIIIALVVIGVLLSVAGAVWYSMSKSEPTQPPAPTGCGCKNEFAKTAVGQEIKGANYSSTYHPVPLDQCQALCDSVGCDWISWAQDDNCVLKKGNPSTGYSYIKTTDCPLEVKNDSANVSSNTVIRTDSATTFDACKKLCDSEPTCELAYWDGASNCTLKAGAESTNYAAYVNIGQMCPSVS